MDSNKKPRKTWFSNIFYWYGYLEPKTESFKLLARKNKITGKVDMWYHNRTFNYWNWWSIDQDKRYRFKKE